jgi:hypothetical protein
MPVKVNQLFTEVVFVKESDFYKKMLEKFPTSSFLQENYERTKDLPGRYEAKYHPHNCRCPACIEKIQLCFDLNFCPPEDFT